MQATVDISKALTIGGWMSERELLWLAYVAKKYSYIVEFGSLHGRSTRALADNLNMNGGKIWAVDPWKGDYYTENGSELPFSTYVYPYFCKNLADHIISGKVVPVREFSYRFSLPCKVDMVFIDGDHRYETVKKDIKKAQELVINGGMIAGHDYGHPEWSGVKQAVDELLGKVEIENTIWFQTKL